MIGRSDWESRGGAVRRFRHVQSSQIFRSLRSLRVMVVHPPDNHGQELVAQLARIGCRTDTLWPGPSAISSSIDVVFIEISDKVPEGFLRLLNEKREHRPTVIALAGYENPLVLKLMLDIKAEGVITKPLRPYGVLSCLVMARRTWDERRRLNQKIESLQEKIRSNREINRAKAILMKLYDISEEEAYCRIRSQAMAKRASTVSIAHSIINAAEILGDKRT